MRKFLLSLRLQVHRREVDQELDDELQFHSDAKIEENIGKGMSPEEARRAARIELGGLDQAKESVRAARTGAWIETFVQDVRFGLRVLSKSPAFTAVAVLILCLGIGAANSIFTLLNAILYRELPVPHAEQLVQLRVRYHTGQPAPLSLPMFQALGREQDVFSGMFAWSSGGPTDVEIDGKLARNNVFYVSGTYFSDLWQRPLLGHLIGPADANPSGPLSRVAVISYGFWQTRFAGSPGVLGQQIVIAAEPFTIIGVTPKNFSGLSEGAPTDIMIPFTAFTLVQPRIPFKITSGHYLWLSVMARLKHGISIAQARGQLSAIWPGILADAVPPDETGERRQQYLSMGLLVTSAVRGPDWDERAQYWRPLYYVMGVVVLILLAVCVNLAGLITARSIARLEETSVRLALGATPWRIARQTLVEGLLLSCAGGLLGLALGFFGARWMLASLSRVSAAPVGLELRPDIHVLSFTTIAAVTTAILFGLAPALHASRVDAGTLVHRDSRRFLSRVGRIGQSLIITQTSLSLVLVLAGGLFTRSFWNLRTAPSGFDRSSVLNVWLMKRPGTANSMSVATYYRELTDRLDHLPGVRAAGLADFVPGDGATPRIDNVASVGASEISTGPVCVISSTMPGFFHSIGMTMLRGRDFTWTDGPRRPRVAIISFSLSRRLFGDRNPVGAYVNVGTAPDFQDLDIIGVVNDARLYNPRTSRPLTIFLDGLQYADGPEEVMLFVRAARDPLPLASAISHVIDSLGYQFVARSTTLEEADAQALTQERLSAMVSGFVAVFALLLTCLGLYGLITQTVTRRTREIGIRAALGADRWNIIRLVLMHAFVLIVVGIALGVVCSLIAARFVAALLYGISPNDVASIIGTALILLSIGLLAAYIPARRASRIDPAVALRHE